MFRILSYILYSYALSRMFWWVRHVTLLTWVCIFIFLISTVFTYKFYDLKFNGVTVEGLIVGASDADPNNPPPGPKWAKFTDENGQDHYSEISIPVFYTTGAQIKVFHERNNPHTNYANTFFNAYGWFIFGLFILGFGGLIAFKQAQAENSYARPRTQNQYDRQDEEENKAPSGCVSVFFKVIAGFMLLQGILSTAHYQYLYWTGVKETAVVIPTQRPNLSTVHKSNEKVLYIADKDLILSGPDLKRTKLYKEVEILYDPDKPSRITMNDSDNAYGYLLIGIFLMIYAWAPTLVIALFYRIKRKFR